MKTLISAATVAIVMFTFGPAFADDDRMPELVTPGTVIAHIGRSSFDWSIKTPAAGDPGFASADDGGIPSLNAKNDIGSLLYADVREERGMAIADAGVRGSAAGGVAKRDISTVTWDKLLDGLY